MTRIAWLLWLLVLGAAPGRAERLALVNDPTDTPEIRARMAATARRNVAFLEQVQPRLAPPGVGERFDELEVLDAEPGPDAPATLMGGRVLDYGLHVLLVDDEGRHVFPRERVKALRRGRANEQPGRPDLDVAYIERTPRLPAGREPAEGEAVTFVGHIANAGGAPTTAFVFRWIVDGVEISMGTAGSLEPGTEVAVTCPWTWHRAARRVALTVTPGRPLDEISTANNVLDDPLHGLPILITTSKEERARATLAPNELGTYSHADTVQQRVRTWNFALADSVYPSTPDGCRTRLRVDRIVELTHAPDTVPGRAQLCALRTEGAPHPLYADVNGYGPFTLDRTPDRLPEHSAAELNASVKSPSNPEPRSSSLSLQAVDATGLPLPAKLTGFPAGTDPARLTAPLLVTAEHQGRREEYLIEPATLLRAAGRAGTPAATLTLRTGWSPNGPAAPAAVRCTPPAAMHTRVTVERSPATVHRYAAYVVPARENAGAPDPAPVWQHEPAGEADQFEFEVELPRGPVLLRVIAYDAAGRPSTPAECFVPNLEAAAHAVVTRFGHLFVTNGSLMRREPNGTWAPFHPAPGPRLAGLALTPWGELAATAPDAEALRLYRLDGTLVRETRSPLFRGAEDLAISPNGVAFLACPAERRVVRVELGANRIDQFAAEHLDRATPRALCLLDEDRLAVCDTPNDRVLILDRTDGRLITTLDGLTAPRAAIATPDGQLLVACANGVAVRAGATLAPGRLITEASGGPIGHATGLALDLDGSLLVVEPWLPLRTVTPEHLFAQR